MKHLSPTTSPALQRFVGSAQYESPESYFNTDEDIHCPQAISPGLNARSAGCIARLSEIKVDKDCRQCETGRAILAQVNPDAVILKIKCACGKEAVDGFSTCQICREKANRYYQQKTAKPRFCKRCKKSVGARVHYCIDCRPIVDEELKIKRKECKTKKRLLDRQAKIEKQLAVLI